MEQLAVIGFAHSSAGVAELERVALTEEEVGDLYEEIGRRSSAEMVRLSTCNRAEAIVYGSTADLRAVLTSWKRRVEGPWPEDALRVRRGPAAIRYVVETAAGLRSQVTGDDQILHQLRRAYARADRADSVGEKLHRLLQTALRAGKRVRRVTSIGTGVRSIASLAVERSGRMDGGASDGPVLVLGLGKVGRSVIHALLDRRYGPLRAANRSTRGWASLDQPVRKRIESVAWDRRHEEVQRARLVFVATGAPRPVVTVDGMREVETGASPPTRIYDLALPRNVEPEVGAMRGTELVDLGDLGGGEEGQLGQGGWSREAHERAKRICREEADSFVRWLKRRNTVRPAIEALTKRCRDVRRTLLADHADRFSENDRRELNRLTRSILQKVIARPIARLRRAVNVSETELEHVDEAVEMTAELFGPGER